MSPLALAHDLVLLSTAPAATAINPPLVLIVVEPVVNGSVVSISVEPSDPLEDSVVLAPITR
jgi:hypothetical protein